MKIALIGNPNSGKTTMFNALTGRSERVGNWAGVTVDKKEHSVKKAFSGKENIIAVDLPGAYSISAFTSEEGITSDYIKQENPDVIINILDATNLSRSLFFTTQLLELGIPLVVALNKQDLNKKSGKCIDEDKLSQKLGCPVVATVSTSAKGLKNVVEAAVSIVGTKVTAPFVQENGDTDERKRFEFVNNIVLAVENKNKTGRNIDDDIDAILTNKWVGLPIFAAVMFLVFYISQSTLGTWIAEGVEIGGIFIPGLVPILESFQNLVAELLVGAHPLLLSLLVDGVIGGVIAVVGFLPLVMVMYFLIALLEDCGYMSRVAVILDPIFKRVGLSGKSVIPFVITVGCAVPGIMASRTIHNQRERRATVMLAPFIPCGAKVPVIALFAGAFFDNAWYISALMYFLGIAFIFAGALIINLITGHKTQKSFFIIELAEYKTPSLFNAFKLMCSRGWAYIVKAATIILLCNMAVQLMQTFTWSFALTDSADESILASVASPFAYLLKPIVGVLSWQLAAAAITGFIAKENVVGTLAICFAGLDNLIDTEELAMLGGTADEITGIMAITKVAALAYLMFNLYAPPCFAAIGAMNSEMKSAKWLWGGIGFQLGMGYAVSYLVYTIGTLIIAPHSFDIKFALLGLGIVLVIIGVILALILKNKKLKNDG